MSPADRTRLYQTIASVLGVVPETITEESAPESLEAWDSLAHLKLVLALESEFNVTFMAREMVELRSVRAIVDWFRSRNGQP